MKTTRKLLSYVSPLSLLLISQLAHAQNAQKAPATPAAPSAPAAAPTDKVEPAAPAAPVAPTETAAANTSAAPGAVSQNAALVPPPAAPVAALSPQTPQPVAPVAPVAPPPPPASEQPLPKALAIGNSGTLQIGALLQGWFAVEDGKAIATNPSGGSFDTTAYFRFRRAQIKLAGDVVKDAVSYLVIFDMAKTLKFSQIPATGTATGYKPPGDTSALLDFALTAKSPVADFSIGQWKSPISYEGYSSSAELLLPERAYTTRYFGDAYDMGFKAEKKFDFIKYSLQVLQGTTFSQATGTSTTLTNQTDNNRQKDVALRLELTPIKEIMIGGAALTSVGQRTTQDSTRDILELDANVEAEGFLVRGELIKGWYGATRSGVERYKALGMTASLGYTIMKKVQPVARLSYLNIDHSTDGTADGQPLNGKFGIKSDEIRSYEFGVNYLLDGKFAKLQAAYGYFDMDNRYHGAPHRQQFILSGQVAF